MFIVANTSSTVVLNDRNQENSDDQTLPGSIAKQQ